MYFFMDLNGAFSLLACLVAMAMQGIAPLNANNCAAFFLHLLTVRAAGGMV
jgi:hypothetical protein